MNPATTVVESVYVKISWDEAVANGAAITAYKIYIADANDNYVEETTYCVGTDANLIANRYCYVVMTALKQAPFQLTQGSLVKVKMQAQNLKGWSTLSNANTAGAVIETEPQAPSGLEHVVANTDDTQVQV